MSSQALEPPVSSRPGAPAPISLGRLFLIFLRIGCTTWGGFMAFIAVVSKSLISREIATQEDIADAILVAQVLPGPVAVDMTVAIGYRLRGLPGSAVCWFGSVMPSFVVVTILSVLYMRYGEIKAVQSVFLGFRPAMVAIVLVAALDLGKKQVRRYEQAAIGLAACVAIVRINTWWITFLIVALAGLAGWLLYRTPRVGAKAVAPAEPAASGPKALGFAPLLALAPLSGGGLLVKIFLTFAGMSVTLFGSGYVFIPIIRNTLVAGLHWLTKDELAAGIALTQITPGPILMTAAFVGVKIAGLPGAVAGMLGMFIPPALLTVLAAHSLQAIKRSSAITAALKGVRPAVVGMLIAAAVVVAQTMSHDTPWHLVASLAILAAALIALFRFKLEVALMIPFGGIAGFFLFAK